MLKLINITFLLIGCGSLIDEPHQQIAWQAKPFVEQFYSYKKGLNNNLIVEFTPLIETDGVIGKTFYGNINLVRLDTSLISYMKIDTLFFETVLYHELGHAVLDRGHCYDCYSLMNPNKYVQDFRFYPIKRKQLINELFK